MPIRLPHQARTLLLVADPGLVKLTIAVRATLTIMATCLALFHLADVFEQPKTTAFIGIVVAMMSSMTVNDPRRRHAMATMLAIPIVASGALLLGSGLAPWFGASVAGFCILSFATVAARRYGSRWIAFGITALMTYFSALFFQANLSTLPWMIAALVLATAIAFLLRFGIIPDRGVRRLRWAIDSYHAQLSLILRHVASQLELEERTYRHRQKLLQDAMHLNETAINIEDLLRRDDVKNKLSAARRAQLEHRVFELELAMTALIDGVFRRRRKSTSVDQRRSLGDAILTLATHIDSLAVNIHSDLALARAAKPAASSLQAIEPHARELLKALVAVPMTPVGRERTPAKTIPPPMGLHPTTRQAIQAALAVAIAALVGAYLSPPTWSWAALAAFIVFSGSTRGDTLRRALQRVLGTALGLIAGLVLARLFSDHSTEIALIFICIFLGVYSTSSSYAWATMWFTAMVAVLYRLLGKLSDEILILRLEQTVIGVAFAVLASLLIIPTSTRVSIGLALVQFLTAYADIFQKLSTKDRLTNQSQILESLRTLDSQLRALRLAAAPMLSQYRIARSRLAEGIVHDAAGLVHYARQLSSSGLNAEHQEALGPDFDARCVSLVTRLEAAAKKVQRLIDEGQLPNLSRRTRPLTSIHGVDSQTQETLWFDRINSLLDSMGQRMRLDRLADKATDTAAKSV